MLATSSSRLASTLCNNPLVWLESHTSGLSFLRRGPLAMKYNGLSQNSTDVLTEVAVESILFDVETTEVDVVRIVRVVRVERR